MARHIGSIFVKQVGVLATGTITAQLIAILASPLLTRLYTPEAFGIFAAFSALLAVISSISTLGYTVAIPLAKDEATAKRLFLVAATAVVGITTAVAIVVVFFGDDFAILLGTPSGGVYLWLLPLGLLISGATSVCSYWGVRKKAFARVSWAEANQGAGSVTVQTIMGLLHFDALGMVVGKLAGAVVSYATYHRPTIREIRLAAPRPSFAQIAATAKAYSQYPLYRTPTIVNNMLSRQLPFFLLPFFFGAGPTGLYALTNRVLQTPLAFIAWNLHRVFLSTAMDSTADGSLPKTTNQLYENLVKLSLPTFALFGLAAPEVFSIVFGEPWRQAGVYAQWFLPAIFLRLVCAPLTTLPMVFNRLRVDTIFHAFLLIGQTCALLIGNLLGNSDVAIGMLAAVGAAAWCWYLFWSMSLIGYRSVTAAAPIVRESVYALPFLVPVVLVQVVEWPLAVQSRTIFAALASMAVLLPIVWLRVRRDLTMK